MSNSSEPAKSGCSRVAPWIATISLPLLLISVVFLSALVFGGPASLPAAPIDKTTYVDKDGDHELAYLLVRLEKRTRQVVASHYGRSQSSTPGADHVYKGTLTKNGILPAAVAGQIFSEVVPAATGGRAWVKMVVPEPRNPKNRGDATALELLTELQGGAPFVERTAGGAVYYGEPITATAGCLPCHGEPAGAPDPSFPQFKKNGWKAGEIVGGVIARVAPETPAPDAG